MKITKTTYSGWSRYPCYEVKTSDEFREISNWMYENQVDNFLLSSGSNGYIFQVKSKEDWFMLRWS